LTTAYEGVVRRLPVDSTLLWAAFRVLLALTAFYTAYRGVLLLEGRLHISRGVVYLVVATAMLVVASCRSGSPTDVSDNPPPNTSVATRRTGRWPLDRRWAASLPALAWWGLLLSAIGLGFAFRLYQIGSLPFGVWFDEAQNGIVARQILEDSDYRPVFVGGLTQLPALFFYVFAAALKFVGHGVLALRSVTTAAGILTLVFVYLLARELFDQRVAVLATFFLAVMRWHVNFSRFGMHGIFAPLFMAATFYFLARGLKGKGGWNFLAAAVMAGVGLQGYFSFLLVPFIVAFYLLHNSIFQRVLPWRKLILGVILFGLVTAAVYSPVGIWALKNQDQFNQRTETLTITKNRSAGEVAEVLRESTRKHLLMFNSVGDGNGRHNLPGAPMLDTFTGFLFVLGMGYAVWRWRDSGHFLLVAWVVVTLQGGIWSVEFEAPQGYRTVGLTPAIAMLAALPLGLLWRLATERAEEPGAGPRSRSTRLGFYAMGGAATLVTLFALAQAGRLNFETYFHRQLEDPRAWAEYSSSATFVGKELARLGDEHEVFYSPVFAGQPTVSFLAPDAPSPNPLDAARDLPLGEPKPTVFLLDQGRRPTFDLLRSYYPGGTFVEFGPPGGGAPIVFEAIISSENIQSVRGLTYRYQRTGDLYEGHVAVLDLDWSREPPLPLPFQAEWSGLLKVPTYGRYTLEARAPGTVELYLDGKPLADGEGVARTGELSLAQGLHDIKARVQVKDLGPVQLLWKQEGASMMPVPSAQFFSDPVRRQGLEGSYYAEAGEERGLQFARIDAIPGGRFHYIPVTIPFTIRWRGQINIPAGASYRFLVQAVDEGSLSIDGSPLLTTPGPNRVAEASIELAQGPHDIEITFHQRGGSPVYINVLWVTPDGGPEPIPSELLLPP
jgi:4-amino-4-deoxy-L-arabinose transferase-like glycosyltransferase